MNIGVVMVEAAAVAGALPRCGLHRIGGVCSACDPEVDVEVSAGAEAGDCDERLAGGGDCAAGAEECCRIRFRM